MAYNYLCEFCYLLLIAQYRPTIYDVMKVNNVRTTVNQLIMTEATATLCIT